MRELILLLFYTAVSVVVLTVISNLLYKLKESRSWFKHFAKFVYNYTFLFLIGISVLIIVFIELFNEGEKYLNKDVAEVIYGFANIILSIGVFSGAIKFASTLKLFKDQYKKIVMSDEFNNLLGSKLDAFAHSTEYLEKLDLHQLKELWKDVTLSKYKSSFPSIYEDLKLNLENELFLKANTSFYYKHFYVEYDISLDKVDDKVVNVTYKTKYTIIRNTINEFQWSFWKISNKNNQNDSSLETIIDIDGDEIFNSRKAEWEVDKDFNSETEVNLECREILKGKKQYHVTKTSTYKQNIELDRSIGFGSGRIIDDLFVTIKYSNDLDVFFSKINKNYFIKNEDKANGILQYENRNLLLPGEKFKLFLIRPGK
jgi:hypothetical protein